MAKLIVPFHNFENAPEGCQFVEPLVEVDVWGITVT
jgi:hypothetical protein